jgi:hypothetical protein
MRCGQDIPTVHSKGSASPVTSVSEICEDLFDPSVRAGNRARAWNRPDDRRIKQGTPVVIVAATVKRVLGRV